MEASSGEAGGSVDSTAAMQRVIELEQILEEYKRAYDELQRKLDAAVTRASVGAGARGDSHMEDAEMAIREDRSNQNQVESGTFPFSTPSITYSSPKLIFINLIDRPRSSDFQDRLS